MKRLILYIICWLNLFSVLMMQAQELHYATITYDPIKYVIYNEILPTVVNNTFDVDKDRIYLYMYHNDKEDIDFVGFKILFDDALYPTSYYSDRGYEQFVTTFLTYPIIINTKLGDKYLSISKDTVVALSNSNIDDDDSWGLKGNYSEKYVNWLYYIKDGNMIFVSRGTMYTGWDMEIAPKYLRDIRDPD